ncbi:MAG: fibronectin type III domain-containing protein [Burkholderiaceae bacterium]|nr:fibronectin type III domain-containing protein [Burkholderiaceae bacterium]
MVSPTTRSGKGAELTWAELDANFTDIAAAVNFLLPQDIAYSTAIPFIGNRYMPQQSLSGAVAFTVNAIGAIKGAQTYLRLVGDGATTPTFSGMKEWGGSAGWDARAGIANQIQFFYDGNDYWYSISQAVGASAVDSVAPTFSSAAVSNAARTVIVLSMSEALDAASVPAASAFSVSGGKTVTGVAISGANVNLTVSSAYAYGNAITVQYTKPGSSVVKDQSGNESTSFGPVSVTNNIATVPGAPTIGAATAGNASASVAFATPASNGGAPITGYTVTSSPGGFTGTGSASPVTVPGLTNGTAYTFTATATNSEGTGASSAASNSVTPAFASGPPNQVAGLALGTPTSSAQPLTWTAPSSNGSAITDYKVEYSVASSGTWLTFAHAASTAASITVTGLASGKSYDYRVSAINANGTGSASATVTGATTQNVRANPASYIGSIAESGSDAAGYTYTTSAVTENFTPAFGLAQGQLPVGAWVSVPYTNGTDNSLFGFSTNPNIGAYPAIGLNGIYLAAGVDWKYITNGSNSTAISGAYVAGEHIRIRRVSGTSVVAERSQDGGVTWPTTMATWSVANVPLYLYFYPYDKAAMNRCGPLKGVGLTA